MRDEILEEIFFPTASSSNSEIFQAYASGMTSGKMSSPFLPHLKKGS